MKVLRLLVGAASLVLLIGLLLHLTVADAAGPFRLFFYGLPWPVMAAAWFAIALLGQFRSAARAGCLLLAVACGGWWIFTSYRSEPAPNDDGRALKVLSWNMAHQPLPSADLQSFLLTWRPDIVGLVEVGARHGDSAPLVLDLPSGYEARKLDHALAVVVRGTIGRVHEEELPSHSKFATVEAVVNGAPRRIYIVDGVSNPLASRADVMARVLADVRGKPQVLVMGDFNTPVESALFRPWSKELHHAFNAAGDGLRETWPRWIPVLTIDHIWSSRDVLPLHAEKRWLRSSDHAALLAEFGPR